MIDIQRQPPPGLVDGYTWHEGDRLAAIGDTELRDILDFYYLAEDEGEVAITVRDREDRFSVYRVQTDDLNTLAECFAPMEFKTCAARCVFCFIDQNPEGMRQNIYVKDEDYRFSFLYGNYITLTALGRRGIQRVIDQKLSPLFVSVHATDIEARTKLLGIKRRIDVMEILRHLTSSGIEVHTQIVLCPGWNDGEILDRTLDDLATLHPRVRSISVVPVGLSDHREGLVELAPVTVEDARQAIAQIEARGDGFLERYGSRLAYASDEFYLKVDAPFPDLEFYEDMPQQDTGIGMCRQMIEELEVGIDELLEAPVDGRRAVTVLTGNLAASFFRRDLGPILARVPWLDLRVVGLPNSLYGEGITVAGLMPAKDFLDGLRGLPADAGTVLLPSSPINHDGVYLDDVPVEEVLSATDHEVRIAGDSLLDSLLEVAYPEVGGSVA
jgi:putative radical SAM enzyme (TIGR03279 family)